MIERKCIACGTWNKEEDYCTKCEAPLSPKAVDKAKEEEKARKAALEEPSKFDQFLERTKNHKYLLVRWSYHFFYAIGIVMGAFGALMAWFVAMVNG